MIVGEILESIMKAEAKAADILKDAEKQVRKIEEHNYADVQKMQENKSIETSKAIKTLEHDALSQTSANIVVTLETPSKQKIQSAKDFIIKSIVGGEL